MTCNDWSGSGYFSFWGRHGFFSYWQLLIVLALVILIVGVVISFRKKKINDDSLELLKTQFIEGKISEEEYLNRKNVIM